MILSRVSAPHPEPLSPPSGRKGRLLWTAVVALIVSNALFALMVFTPQWVPFKFGVANSQRAMATLNEIERVATRFSQNFVTWDAGTLEQDFLRADADTTDDFETQVHAGLGGPVKNFRKAVRNAQSASTGDVKAASITSRDDETATVFVFLTQTTRKERRTPDTKYLLLELTLVRVGDEWKVHNVGTAISPNT